MKNLFETYSHLWPAASHEQLKPLFSQLDVVHYPADFTALAAVKRPQSTVVVTEGAKVKDLIDLAYKGFEHFIQKDRDDFYQELLASGLMAVRPKAFSENPIPFFFTGFLPPKSSKTMSSHLVQEFKTNKSKALLLDRLHTFLGQAKYLSRIRDLCVQVADEMVTNACFSAPMLGNGQRLFQNMDRKSEVTLPGNHSAVLFATFTEQKVVVGCQDPFGSLSRSELLAHLRNVYRMDKVFPKETAGAGFGMKYMIDNSSNFYIYVEKGQKTLVASSFQVGSIKKNLADERHLHLSLR